MTVVRQVALPFLLGATFLLNACTVSVPALGRHDALREGEERLKQVEDAQELPAAPLDVADAVARALMYNLDYRAAFMNEAMARADVSRGKFALWPQLAMSAGYSTRNEFASATSFNPDTGQQTLESSASSEKQTSTAQLQLNWNALDFGLAYLRTRQKGNALLAAEEQRRKAFQSITQEVTTAWWRGLAAQRMEPRLQALRERVESALMRSRQMEEMRLRTQVPILEYRRDLLISLRRLVELQQQVQNARNELTRLISLPAGTPLALQEPAGMDEPAWLPGLSRDQLLRITLANRPELREQGYRQRMAKLEGKIAVASLMPSLNVSAGPRYDSNKFLTHNDWNEGSAQFSFNLLNLAAIPATRRYSKAAESTESLRTDALTVAVASQLGIALRAIETDRRSWCLSRELGRVADERESQSRARSASASGDELTQIQTEVEAVLAGLESAFSFAQLEASHAMLLSTLGVDPYPEDLGRKNVGEVAEQLRSYMDGGLKQRLQDEATEVSPADSGEVEPALKSFEELCVL